MYTSLDDNVWSLSQVRGPKMRILVLVPLVGSVLRRKGRKEGRREKAKWEWGLSWGLAPAWFPGGLWGALTAQIWGFLYPVPVSHWPQSRGEWGREGKSPCLVGFCLTKGNSPEMGAVGSHYQQISPPGGGYGMVKWGVSWAPVDTDHFNSEFSPTLKLEASRDPERCEEQRGLSPCSWQKEHKH